MKPKIDMQSLFMNRHAIEHRLMLAHDGSDLFDDTPEGDMAWGLENDLAEAMAAFTGSGSAIFTFNNDLLRMLINTDVSDLPINQIRLPYPTVYFHFGESELFPAIGEYRVDGVFIKTERSEEAVLHDYCTEEKVKKDKETRLGNARLVMSHPERFDSEIVSDSRELLATGTNGRINEIADYPRRYRQLMDDPDTYYSDPANNYVWGFQDSSITNKPIHYEMTLLFTVIRADGQILPLTRDDLKNYPYRTLYLQFETHKSTVNDAMSTFDPGPEGCSAYTVSDDRDALVRLAFNLVCYLNWADRDILQRYSSDNVQAKIDRAQTNKERQRAISKAHSAGHRLINFCGFNTPKTEQGQAHGGTVATHWRRGHWRNQPFGKKLSQNRLTWIKPVIVNKGETAPQTTTIYRGTR